MKIPNMLTTNKTPILFIGIVAELLNELLCNALIK
jgi:hypothetical protein